MAPSQEDAGINRLTETVVKAEEAAGAGTPGGAGDDVAAAAASAVLIYCPSTSPTDKVRPKTTHPRSLQEANKCNDDGMLDNVVDNNNYAVSGLELIDDVPSPTPPQYITSYEAIDNKAEIARKKLLPCMIKDDGEDLIVQPSKLEMVKAQDVNTPPVPIEQFLASTLEAIEQKDRISKKSKSLNLNQGDEGKNISMMAASQLEFIDGDIECAAPLPVEQLAVSLEAMETANKNSKVTSMMSERNNAASIMMPERTIVANQQDQTTSRIPIDRTIMTATIGAAERNLQPTPNISMLLSPPPDAADEFLPPPFTVLEATLVDDVVYDAIPFQEADYREQEKPPDPVIWWTRRRKQCALLGVASVVFGSVGVYYLIKKTDSSINNTTTSLIWKPRGQPIVGNAADDQFGSFVTLSGSGNIVAVGTGGEEGGRAGYVKLYYWSNDDSNWGQIGKDILSDVIEYSSSCSVALSDDGKTLAIGSEENDDLPGRVKLYSVNISSWQRLGNDIIGEAPGDRFGHSVSLSTDGRTLAVGANENDEKGNRSGHVRIYRFDDAGTEWTQLGDDIDGEAEFDMSGLSVALSADGTVVVIGSPFHMNFFGQARVYYWNNTVASWEKRGKDLVGRPSNDHFGKSVAISDDGNIVAVGAPAIRSDNRKGYVQVYHIIGDDWQQKGDDINGKYPGGTFGEALSLSRDGKLLAIGNPYSPGEDNMIMGGSVAVYGFNDLTFGWIQRGQDINGNATYDNFGKALSLSADGGTVAISSPFHDANTGYVRLFSIENTDGN